MARTQGGEGAHGRAGPVAHSGGGRRGWVGRRHRTRLAPGANSAELRLCPPPISGPAQPPAAVGSRTRTAVAVCRLRWTTWRTWPAPLRRRMQLLQQPPSAWCRFGGAGWGAGATARAALTLAARTPAAEVAKQPPPLARWPTLWDWVPPPAPPGCGSKPLAAATARLRGKPWRACWPLQATGEAGRWAGEGGHVNIGNRVLFTMELHLIPSRTHAPCHAPLERGVAWMGGGAGRARALAARGEAPPTTLLTASHPSRHQHRPPKPSLPPPSAWYPTPTPTRRMRGSSIRAP